MTFQCTPSPRRTLTGRWTLSSTKWLWANPFLAALQTLSWWSVVLSVARCPLSSVLCLERPEKKFISNVNTNCAIVDLPISFSSSLPTSIGVASTKVLSSSRSSSVTALTSDATRHETNSRQIVRPTVEGWEKALGKNCLSSLFFFFSVAPPRATIFRTCDNKAEQRDWRQVNLTNEIVVPNPSCLYRLRRLLSAWEKRQQNCVRLGTDRSPGALKFNYRRASIRSSHRDTFDESARSRFLFLDVQIPLQMPAGRNADNATFTLKINSLWDVCVHLILSRTMALTLKAAPYQFPRVSEFFWSFWHLISFVRSSQPRTMRRREKGVKNSRHLGSYISLSVAIYPSRAADNVNCREMLFW